MKKNISPARSNWNVHINWSIGHFRVPLCLCFKASISAKSFLYQNDFDLHENETACRTHFHIKGFALRLFEAQENSDMAYRVYAHDVMAATLVFQNNGPAAMLVYQTSPVGIKLFSFLFNSVPGNLHGCWPRDWKRSIEEYNNYSIHTCWIRCFRL